MAEEGPRTRTRLTASTSKPITIYGKRYDGVASDPYKFTTVSSTRDKWSPYEHQVMQDVVTKNYRARSASGEVICNPSDRIVRLYTYDPPARYYRNLVTEKYVSGVKCWQGDVWDGLWPITKEEMGYLLVPGMYPVIAQDEAVLKDLAVTKAHANASQAEVSALMIMGEGRKTVESLVSIVGRAVRILLAIKKLDAKFLAKQISPDELANRYMEARYALRPLMYDAEGVLKAWQTTIPNLSRRSTARGFTAKEWDFEETVTFLDTASSTNRTVKRTLHCSATFRAGVLCDVDVSHLNVWGMDTVFETALELIPFSFIANWFFNIADTLASWTPKAGVRELASWVTATTVAVSTNELIGITNAGYTGLIHPSMSWGGKYTESVVRKQRFVNPTRRMLPHWNVSIDTLKLIDLTKIISQMLS